MNAKICDRCKQFYKIADENNYLKSKTMDIFKVVKITQYDGSGFSTNTLDLCPKCLQELAAFMYPKK